MQATKSKKPARKRTGKMVSFYASADAIDAIPVLVKGYSIVEGRKMTRSKALSAVIVGAKASMEAQPQAA